MIKLDEITDGLYARLRSTGSQPPRLYGLAKLHKKNTPLRPVLPLYGSSYQKLNETLAKSFDKTKGAKIETNFEAARVMIENAKLNSDESVISLDLKSLYAIVSLTLPFTR